MTEKKKKRESVPRKTNSEWLAIINSHKAQFPEHSAKAIQEACGIKASRFHEVMRWERAEIEKGEEVVRLREANEDLEYVLVCYREKIEEFLPEDVALNLLEEIDRALIDPSKNPAMRREIERIQKEHAERLLTTVATVLGDEEE